MLTCGSFQNFSFFCWPWNDYQNSLISFCLVWLLFIYKSVVPCQPFTGHTPFFIYFTHSFLFFFLLILLRSQRVATHLPKVAVFAALGGASLFSLIPEQEMRIRGWKVRGRTAWQIALGWCKGQCREGRFLADFYPFINTIRHLAAINKPV